MNAMLLAYGWEDGALKALRRLCAQRDVRLRRVPPEDYAQPLGALSGVEKRREPAEAGESATLPEPVLVFAHFGERQFGAFLEQLRTARVGLGVLKAVLTPTNAAWDVYTLFRELEQERTAVRRASDPPREP